MLSYAEAEPILLQILGSYIEGMTDKKIILRLIESGSWRAAIYEIDKSKCRALTTNDRKKLEDIFGLYC